MSRPSRSSSWVRSTACSSGVRLGTVESRQWWVSPRGAVGSCSVPMPTPTLSSGAGHVAVVVGRVEADHRLGVADVNDQEHALNSLPRVARFRSAPVPPVGPEQVEPEVEHRGRVGQRADRNPVRSGRGVGADGGQRHPTGDLGEDRARARPGAPPRWPRRRCPGSMLSSSTASAPARAASATWSRASHSISTIRPGHSVAGPAHRVGDARPGQVVVLDQDGVGEAGAVAGAAAGAHGRLLEHAQARRGLAGVEDLPPTGCARARPPRTAPSGWPRPTGGPGSSAPCARP